MYFGFYWCYIKYIIFAFNLEKAQKSSLHADKKSELSQCTKIGEHGETITVSVITEESHAAVEGKKYKQYFVLHQKIFFMRTLFH